VHVSSTATRRSPDAYFEQALKLDPHHLPSLIALGRYRYLMGEISEALLLLQRASMGDPVELPHGNRRSGISDGTLP
jgi:Tfp pilus assembly protein PilF